MSVYDHLKPRVVLPSPEMNNKCMLFFILCVLASTESRQGWKTAGNGYFIYKASTNFNATQRLEIAGKFSTKPNSQLNNVLVAGEDSSGTLLFQYSVFQSKGQMVALQGGVLQVNRNGIADATSGYLFSFTLVVTQTVVNGIYNHNFYSSLNSARWTVQDYTKWNFDNITLYIGGYKQSIKSGSYFEGCLSDFTFQGVNIINTYFQEYPRNTNPIKGTLTVGNFSNMAEACDDAVSTAPPTVTSTNVTPTTTSHAVASASSFGLLVIFTVVVLFLF